MASSHQPRRCRETRSVSPWAPPYREIEMKIGEALRERYKPARELPQRLLVLLTQISRQDKDHG